MGRDGFESKEIPCHGGEHITFPSKWFENIPILYWLRADIKGLYRITQRRGPFGA